MGVIQIAPHDNRRGGHEPEARTLYGRIPSRLQARASAAAQEHVRMLVLCLRILISVAKSDASVKHKVKRDARSPVARVMHTENAPASPRPEPLRACRPGKTQERPPLGGKLPPKKLGLRFMAA